MTGTEGEEGEVVEVEKAVEGKVVEEKKEGVAEAEGRGGIEIPMPLNLQEEVAHQNRHLLVCPEQHIR